MFRRVFGHSSKTEVIISQASGNELVGGKKITNHPRAVIYFKPQTSITKPELDYNDICYYNNNIDYQEGNPIPTDYVKKAIYSQEYDRGGFEPELMAKRSGGDPVVAHLPYAEDHPNMHLAFWDFLGWYKLKENDSPKMFPNELLSVIDPIPNINVNNPVLYSFPDFLAPLFVASYADSLHLMRVDSFIHYLYFQVTSKWFWFRRGKYHEVDIHSERRMYEANDYDYIPRGTIAVHWNALGVDHPSFIPHFKRLYANL